MYIETDLSKIKYLASVRAEENIRFRAYLKDEDSQKVDAIVLRLHDELVRQVDCTQCGNCCNELKPKLHKNDMVMFAGWENISPENYMDNYCEKDDGDIFLTTLPCRYLEGRKCGIYENRPEDCRCFPYTDKKDFISRLWSMLEFYAICPIVFNLMEGLKERFRFRS